MKEALLSVGIDIGTSTSQLVFSRLTVENMASSFSVPRIAISGKDVIYQSAIYFTPLIDEEHIDGDALRRIIEREYQQAEIAPDEVDTGAVIITGETARKENAAEVLRALSGLAGDFVVATAGPDLESIIAGKGAGCDSFSKEKGVCCVNIDIGGGTSNLVVFDQGEVAATGCMDIGGRLVKIDPASRRITYIMPKIARLIKDNGWSIAVGDLAERDKLWLLAQKMAELLAVSVGLLPMTEECRRLETNKGLTKTNAIEYISFSGGVADFIYPHQEEKDCFRFGDMGILLGEAIAQSILCQKLTVITAKETIRATVVGAGSHTMNVSGSTITYTDDLFPLKNLPIVKLSVSDEKNISAVLPQKLSWYHKEPLAVGLKGPANPTFDEVRHYAQELAAGMADYLTESFPLVIVLEEDIAMVLGQALKLLLPPEKPLICLDSVQVETGDYIDIGKPVAAGAVLPVVVKTIVFNQ